MKYVRMVKDRVDITTCLICSSRATWPLHCHALQSSAHSTAHEPFPCSYRTLPETQIWFTSLLLTSNMVGQFLLI